MNNSPAVPLSEIFPLRLRPREEMRFYAEAGEMVVERLRDAQKFAIREWQYQLMRRIDGQRTFEEISKEIYREFQGDFTAVGLTNFYQWLCEEGLVVSQSESVFELISDEETEAPTGSVEKDSGPSTVALFSEKIRLGVKQGLAPGRAWQKQALKISAIVLFSLAVLRIAYIAAPIIEPPVKLLYTSVEDYFYQDTKLPAERTAVVSERRETPVQEMALAGRAPVAPAELPERSEPDPIAVSEAIPEPAPFEQVSEEDLERLRREMAECRIRRDEFYLQNNEVGYRYEVQKMTALAKRIGEIEAQLD